MGNVQKQLKRMSEMVQFFFSCFIIQVELSPFSRHHFPPSPPTPTSHPPTFPTLALSMGPLYMFLDDPSLSFSCYLPPSSTLVTFSLFFISVSLVIVCLFVLLIRFYLQVRSGILKVFVFHCLAHFTQHNFLQFHPCCHKAQELLLSLCCVEFHCVNAPQLFDPLIY